MCKKDTVKALLSPGGAYLLFAVLEGGLNREGALLERGAYYKHGLIIKLFLCTFMARFIKQKLC